MKIAFFCGEDDKFLRDIIAHTSRRYDVRCFRGGSIDEMQVLLLWADVAWFEWCDSLIIAASQLPKTCRMICRLHSYEAFTDAPSKVNWKNVDDLVFVAPHVRDILLAGDLVNNHIFQPSLRTHIINNGVDVQRFCNDTQRERGFNLAYVGYINHKKNPSLLIQCMKYLTDIDDRYVLHIAGTFQELRFELYFKHMVKAMSLEKNIVFHGWVGNIPDWLEDKHYIVTTSVFESFCYAIAEGMSCGLKPIIHNFVGADGLYPEKYLFNNVRRFAEMVIGEGYKPSEYRQYIVENYSLEKQLKAIEGLICQ